MAIIQRPEAVGDIQDILNKLGYDTGTVDGMWGDNTSAGFNHFVHDVQAHVFNGQPDEQDGLYGARTHAEVVARIDEMYGDRLSAEEQARLTAALGVMIEKVDPNGNPHPLGRPLINRLHQPQPLEDFESHIKPSAGPGPDVAADAPEAPSVLAEDTPPIVPGAEIAVAQDGRTAPAMAAAGMVDEAPVIAEPTPEELLDSMAAIEARQMDIMRYDFLGNDPDAGPSDERAQARVVNMRDPENFDRMRDLMQERGNPEAVALLDEFKTLEEQRQALHTVYESVAPAIEMETPAVTPEGLVDMGPAFDAAASLTGNPAVVPLQENGPIPLRQNNP